MPYTLGNEQFVNKEAIKARCRQILASTADGQPVSSKDYPFLLDLFSQHDEWDEKVGCGVQRITTETTMQGTRCFVLVRVDGTSIDISFAHAVKLIRTSRSDSLVPQALLDYRNAARTAVQGQVREFRNRQLALSPTCPITGIVLAPENCEVDHEEPLTLDRLLLEFTVNRGINPLEIKVDSVNGTVATFADAQLAEDWEQYHRQNCSLRLISHSAHRKLKSPKVDWALVLRGGNA